MEGNVAIIPGKNLHRNIIDTSTDLVDTDYTFGNTNDRITPQRPVVCTRICDGWA